MIIVLGSRSSRRLEILQSIVPIETNIMVVPADIDEKAIRHPNPTALTIAIARAKNEAVRKRLEGGLRNFVVITADTVALCEGQVREKPEDVIQLRQFVSSYGVHPVTAITAVWVHVTSNGWSGSITDKATVTFNPFIGPEIDAIVKEPVFMDAAGGFMIEHPLMRHRVGSINGDPHTVQGFPGHLVKLLLEEVIGG